MTKKSCKTSRIFFVINHELHPLNFKNTQEKDLWLRPQDESDSSDDSVADPDYKHKSSVSTETDMDDFEYSDRVNNVNKFTQGESK